MTSDDWALYKAGVWLALGAYCGWHFPENVARLAVWLAT